MLTGINRHINISMSRNSIEKFAIEFLGIWEEIYNASFNSPEFEGIKNQAGLNCAGEQHADREKKTVEWSY